MFTRTNTTLALRSFHQKDSKDSDDKSHVWNSSGQKTIMEEPVAFPTDPFAQGATSRNKSIQTEMLDVSRIRRLPILQAVPLPPGSIPCEIFITEGSGGTRFYKATVCQPPNCLYMAPAVPREDDIQRARTGGQVAVAWGETESVRTNNVSLNQFMELNPKRRGAVYEKIEENINLVKINGARMNLYDLRMELQQCKRNRGINDHLKGRKYF